MKANFSPIENLYESDPLKLKKYKTRYFKTIYTLCALIPSLIAFSLVFFLIFFMSPRGRHMRQYQREIYDWNHDTMA